ncbi:MAG: glycosyltransferase family 2 protein [candidate division Zixibacteria bacterium]|nr:glycosyltransferase family 2 protein [candidate division Zixibacteria bacterium]
MPIEQDKKIETHKTVLSVVIPVLNEEGNVAYLLESLIKDIKQLDVSYEIIFIDDGSSDKTWHLITEASKKNAHIKGISLSRNFGHQNAVFTGLHYASGKAIITMDGDCQHPPEKIAELYNAWQKGFKIVNTKRIDSEDFSFIKRFTSRLFNKIFSLLSGLPMSKGLSDFRLIDRQVVDVIKDMRDTDLFFRGITHWVGFSATTITFQANKRYSGSTKFSLWKLFKFSISAILSFSIVPLKFSIWLGFITSLLAFAELVYIFIRYIQGISVPGWASTLTVISFMFGMLFILLGIIGAYLGNIFETLKNRPRFLIQDMSGFIDDNG